MSLLTASAQVPADWFPQIAPLPSTLPGTVIPLPEPPSAVLWSVALPTGASSQPVVSGEHVYIARLPGTVTAYRGDDGGQAWTAAINPDQHLAVDGDLVFVASADALHALRAADGVVAWRVAVGALAAPLLARDGWVIAASASKLIAFRASDGGTIWTVDSGPVRERCAILGDTLFVPLADGAIEARDLETGASKWRQRIGGAPQEPLAIGDRLFVGGSDRYFYALDARDGEIEWRSRVGAAIRGVPATDGHRVYYAALDNLIRALDYRDGALKWHTGVPFRPFVGPVLVGETLVVSGAVEQIHLLRTRDGSRGTAIPLQQKLAVAPAIGTVKGRPVAAAVTGSLAESWRLTLVALPISK